MSYLNVRSCNPMHISYVLKAGLKAKQKREHFWILASFHVYTLRTNNRSQIYFRVAQISISLSFASCYSITHMVFELNKKKKNSVIC